MVKFNFIYRRVSKLHSTRIEHIIKDTNIKRDKKISNFIEKTRNVVSDGNAKTIIDSDIISLLDLIKNKKVKCSEVLVAYARRAGTIGKDLNLIADVNFEDAFSQSQLADKDIADGKNIKPLHGIPVSFYEQISVKGMLTTCGYSEYHNRVNSSDSLYAKILRDLGAIPFLKSNIPQGFMSLEASNFIWGTAINPWNPNKTAGGSNGGEAGLIASRCSPLGIGGDLFGSIRNPCNFTGVYGYKPTSNKNSKFGGITYNGTPFLGATAIQTSWGPIARSARDILHVAKAVTGKFDLDNYTNNSPFNEKVFNEEFNSKPLVGVITDSNYIKSAPCIKEAIQKTSDYLNNKGFIVNEFPLKFFKELIEVGNELMINSDAIEWIDKERGEEDLAFYHKPILKMRENIRKNTHNSNKIINSSDRLEYFIDSHKILSRSEYIEKIKRFNELKSEFANFWRSKNYYGLISPVWSVPATNHGVSQKILPFADLCFLENYADMPACAIPLYLNKNIDVEETITDKLSNTLIENTISSMNVPIGIQVAAISGEDEKMLRLMKVISEQFKFEDNEGFKVHDFIGKTKL